MRAYHLESDFTPSAIIKVAFSPFKNQFIRDEKKYESIVERNRINGLKGGRPSKPKEPTGLSGNPSDPKKADSVNDSKNDSGSGNDNGSEKDKPLKKKRTTPVLAKKPNDVEQEIWDDWQHLRKTKKAPVTRTVLNGAIKEAEKAGLSLTNFLAIWCVRGSQGLEASWLTPKEKSYGKSEDKGDIMAWVHGEKKEREVN